MAETRLEVIYNVTSTTYTTLLFNVTGNFVKAELGNITCVAFYGDYSYENRQMQNVMTLNNPITHEVPEGGFVPLSFFVTGETGTVQIRTNKRINN